MQEATYREVTEAVEVQVRPYFVPERSNLPLSFYFFAYEIRIANRGSRSCQLLSRHWIIRNGTGEEEQVKGPGVVGQQPILEPGSEFEYTSFCPLRTPTGNMRGRFFFVDSDQRKFEVKVPVFFFHGPARFH